MSEEATTTAGPGQPVGDEGATGGLGIRVHLPSFDGPLDLLLHLIQRDEIDIYDIPIARITRQYLGTLELMQELDLEVAGEFIVMAATLMRIKARMLLPAIVAEEDEEDPREGLVRQLLEYRRFKEAAKDLERFEGERRLLWERGAPAQLEDPEDGELVPVSLFRLLDALKKALDRSKPAYVHTIQAETISLEEAIAVMKERLRERTRLLFAEVLEQFETRIEKVTAFLGLLELLKQGSITALQEELFGPIWINWRGESAAPAMPIEQE
jgi:segregation and condensation protein A